MKHAQLQMTAKGYGSIDKRNGRFWGGIRRVGVLANSLSSQIYVWDLWTAELALSILSMSGNLWKKFLEKNYEEIMGVQKGYGAYEY